MGRRKYGAFQPLDPPEYYVPAAAEYFWDEAEFKTAIAPPTTADDLKVDKASKQITYSSDIFLSSDDHFVGIDTLTDAVIVTLPYASTVDNGKQLVIKDESGNAASNNIIIKTDQSESATIDGYSEIRITSNYGALNLYFNGSGWHIY
tara:strand:- start:89 stop:532 length:444 start_codon:yes stop_codon:yes gene_type:complete